MVRIKARPGPDRRLRPSSVGEPSGSSGIGEVIGQATGSSSSGALGFFLPLVCLRDRHLGACLLLAAETTAHRLVCPRVQTGMSLASDRASGVRARIFAVLAGLVLAAVVATGGAGPEAAAATLRPLQTGVSYVYGNDPVEFEHVRATGARLVLTPLRWASVAPEAPPAVGTRKTPPTPTTTGTSSILGDPCCGSRPHAGPAGTGRPGLGAAVPTAAGNRRSMQRRPGDLAAFTTAATRRYSGQFDGLPRVRYWQGLERAQSQPLLQPAVRWRHAGIAASLPHADQHLLRRGEGGRSVGSRARRRPRPDRGSQVHDRPYALHPSYFSA